MATTFRPYLPDQIFLLPPSLRDWLPEGHLVYFISDVVDRLDLGAFYVRYAGDGRRNAPYHPAMLVKVLIYAYALGVTSSRSIAKRLETDVAFRVLAANNQPSHRTICRFRTRHLSQFVDLFQQVVRVAQAAGLVDFGTLSIDGTKVRANASKRKAMSYGYVAREQQLLRAELARLVAQAEAEDEAEDLAYGEDGRGDELPSELALPAGRASALDRAIAEVAAEQAATSQGGATVDDTGAEGEEASAPVVIREGCTVEGELALRGRKLAKVSEAKVQLEARAAEADKAKGRKPGQDRNPKGGRPYKRSYGVPDPKAQYNFTDPESRIMKTSQEGFQQCYNVQVAVDAKHQLIVQTKVSNQASDTSQLIPMVDAVAQVYGARPTTVLADAGYCSEANLTALEAREIDGYVAIGREGKAQVAVDPDTRPATSRMQAKLKRPDGQAMYKDRKWLSEAPNGWIKRVLGFRQFSVRGLDQVAGEWELLCLGLNLRRMSTMELTWTT